MRIKFRVSSRNHPFIDEPTYLKRFFKSCGLNQLFGKMMTNPLQNHRVLYVDDHADTVEMVTLMLEAGGFEVLSRSNIKDGLKAAAAEQFDLYLLDLWLPDGSGLDLCKKIREFDSRTPVVFYSAAAFAGDKQAAFESGGQAYLIKPTDSPDLCSRLSQLLIQNGHCRDADI